MAKKKPIQPNKATRLFCLLLCLLSLFCASVHAAGTGSLKVDMGEAVSGIPITLLRVAEGDGTLTDDCAGAGLTAQQMTSDPERPACAAALYHYVTDNALTGTGTQLLTGEDGTVFFPDLSEGIYLVWGEEGRVEFLPFLVSIPTVAGDFVIYDVEARPKAEPPEPTPSGPPDIPQTGVVIWPVYLLLALGVLTLAAGVTVLVRGRKGKHE